MVAKDNKSSPESNQDRLLDAWRNLNREMGFFTAATSLQIPDRPGIYAWFLPLNIADANSEALNEFLRDAVSIHAADAGKREVGGAVQLNWEQIELTGKRASKLSPDEAKLEKWMQIAANPQAFQAFRKALYVGAIFTRPLYVGLTRDLARRYRDHVDGRSDFGPRLEAYACGSVSVAELVFACIPIQAMAMSDEQIELLEWILKGLCQPGFGVR